MKYLKLTGGILTVIAALILLAGALFGWQWVTAPFYGKLDKRQTVQSGDFRLYSYNHFYDACASIASDQQSLQAQKDMLSRSDSISQRQLERIHTRIAALKGQIAREIEQYNADARKEESMGQFKAHDLPNSIPRNPEGVISCR